MKNYTSPGIINELKLTSMLSQVKSVAFVFLVSLLLFLVGSSNADAQSVLHSVGATTICQGTSTTIAVNVDGGDGIYTVVYNDGTSNFTVNNYKSNDTNGDDPITVSPTSTKTYSLVSVSFGAGVPLPVDTDTKVTITVNPLPSGLVVSPSTYVCPGVDFTITASATNGSIYELWNSANTVKISNLPYTTNISTTTSYKIRVTGGLIPACTSTFSYTVTVDNVLPTITCPANQNLSMNAGSNTATLPDFTAGLIAHDNCVRLQNKVNYFG